VYQAFFDEVERRAFVDYHITSCGCLGECEGGAIVLVYPEGILYGHVTPDDVPQIVDQHLLTGRPVAHLVLQGAEGAVT
jgi:(2Fe-2S) ferredoxin